MSIANSPKSESRLALFFYLITGDQGYLRPPPSYRRRSVVFSLPLSRRTNFQRKKELTFTFTKTPNVQSPLHHSPHNRRSRRSRPRHRRMAPERRQDRDPRRPHRVEAPRRLRRAQERALLHSRHQRHQQHPLLHPKDHLRISRARLSDQQRRRAAPALLLRLRSWKSRCGNRHEYPRAHASSCGTAAAFQEAESRDDRQCVEYIGVCAV